MKKVLLAIAFCVGSVALCARSFDIAVWRGETRNAIVQDFAEIGAHP
jgi:hypothetical protein